MVNKSDCHLLSYYSTNFYRTEEAVCVLHVAKSYVPVKSGLYCTVGYRLKWASFGRNSGQICKYTEYSHLECETVHSNCMGVTRIRWNMFFTRLGYMNQKMLVADFI